MIVIKPNIHRPARRPAFRRQLDFGQVVPPVERRMRGFYAWLAAAYLDKKKHLRTS